jgi:hypothetical protein
MPRWADHDREWEDESYLDDDDEGFEHVEDEDEDDEPTISCPYCRREIHEDSEQCPYCRSFIPREDAPPRKPWWMVLGVGVCLYVVYRWIVRW